MQICSEVTFTADTSLSLCTKIHTCGQGSVIYRFKRKLVPLFVICPEHDERTESLSWGQWVSPSVYGSMEFSSCKPINKQRQNTSMHKLKHVAVLVSDRRLRSSARTRPNTCEGKPLWRSLNFRRMTQRLVSGCSNPHSNVSDETFAH